MPSRTEPTGWTVSSIDVIAAGSRGSDVEISIQPSTWEESASVPSHAADGHAGREVRHAEHERDGERHEGGHDGRVEQRPGGPAHVLVAVAEDQDEARVGDPGEHAVEDAARRVGPVRAALQRAGDEHDAEQGERQGREDAAAGRLVQDGPGCEAAR